MRPNLAQRNSYSCRRRQITTANNGGCEPAGESAVNFVLLSHGDRVTVSPERISILFLQASLVATHY